MTNKPNQLIHMVGIAGAGMSGIAKVLSEQGFKVSGSDLQDNSTIKKLQQLGIQTYEGHASSNVKDGVDILVISSAIPTNNVEVKTAIEKGIPVLKRGQMLAKLVNEYNGIAVAGAHGKTTTTSMISLVCSAGGVDPSFIIGGEIQGNNLNAKLGKGKHFIVEADESDASFLDLKPYIAVVTNIEDDHLDYYHTFDKILLAFQDFMTKIKANGFGLIFGEDKHLLNIAKNIKQTILVYGENEKFDYYLKNWKSVGPGSVFDVYYKNNKLGTLKLSIPGKHNAFNALATVAVANELGISFEIVKDTLLEFKGAKRRFEIIGKENDITIVDDYAHHPTEIEVTVKAAKEFHNGRVIVIFQPHRYSRTKLLGKEIGRAFCSADLVIISDVYAAGEQPITGIDGELIWASATEAGYNAVYIPLIDDIEKYLASNIEANDLIITMGAGDIWGLGIRMVEKLKELTVLRS